MIQLDSAVYNSDDESHDTCPTCGARVKRTTPIDPTTTYRLSCTDPRCPWTHDLETAPTGVRSR